ncbi:MAG: 6,7-dimethyl-8-ribityllumazine synthase [Firmicutes bacterium]|nr:6,7-dimethyl-8-ribityllumazine synthase [Bacillota bacterium]
MKIYEGQLVAREFNFALVVSRFNEFISHRLLEGALDCLKRHEADEGKIDVVWVPGAFEVPVIARKLAQGKRYHAIICLGAVIRGDTPHFDYVASEVAKGIAQVGLQSGIPVAFGIITSDTIEQAIERAGSKAGNKGWAAALSAIEMADLCRRLEGATSV